MTRKTLSIGGATYDVFVKTGDEVLADHARNVVTLPLGKKVKVRQVIEACGGGAANTSVGLSRLGCAASFCGIIGSDQWGDSMLQNLHKEHVETKSATIVEGETSSFSLIFSVASGERVILYDPGTNAHMHDATFDREGAGAVDWIYLNHLHGRGCIIEDDIAHILQLHPKIGFTWNPGGDQLRRGMHDGCNPALLAECDLLLLNAEEAQLFTGTTSVADAMKTLTKAGARRVCVTDGKRGARISDGKKTYHAGILPDVTVVDATGAGDGFGTGATWAVMQGLDLPDVLRAGTILAASVVGAIGAQAGLLTDIEMQTKLRETALDIMEITP